MLLPMANGLQSLALHMVLVANYNYPSMFFKTLVLLQSD
jgi:hypothetical protein